MQMQERTLTSTGEGYRFGFNGMEQDDDVKGRGNSLDFGARIYDSRIGRWMTIDPYSKMYPSHSTYSFVNNNPIVYYDVDGKAWLNFNVVNTKKSNTIKVQTNSEVFYISAGLVTNYFDKSATFNEMRKTFQVGGEMDLNRIDMVFASVSSDDDARMTDKYGSSGLSVVLNDGSSVPLDEFTGDEADISRVQVQISINSDNRFDETMVTVAHEVGTHGKTLANLSLQYQKGEINLEQFQQRYQVLIDDENSNGMASEEHKNLVNQTGGSITQAINTEVLSGLRRSGRNNYPRRPNGDKIQKFEVGRGRFQYYNLHDELKEAFSTEYQDYSEAQGVDTGSDDYVNPYEQIKNVSP